MSGVSAIDRIVDPAGVLARASEERMCGLVLFDLCGEVRRSFSRILGTSGDAAMLGTIRGIRTMAETDHAALAPLAALLGIGLSDLFAGTAGATGGQQIRRITSVLRTALKERNADGPPPWLLLVEPQLLDQSSLRILGLLAEGGSLRLLIHVRRAWELPQRFKRLLDNGLIGRVPDTRFAARDAVDLVSETVGYRVPVIGALALHKMTGGQADQVDLLVDTAPPDALRRALLTGQTMMIPFSDRLTRVIRQDHRELGDDLRSLIGAATIHAHLSLQVAYAGWGRKCVETAIGSGILRRFKCGETQVITPISPLVAGQLWTAMTPYDMAAVQEIELIGNRCCAAGRAGIVLTREDAGPATDPVELIGALEAASEEHFILWATPLATRLRTLLPHVGDGALRRSAAVALARHAYLSKGAHAALRELHANGRDELMWTDPGTVRLVVQICLETGRLLPTAQRIAGMLGLPAPQEGEGAELVALLPADRTSTLLVRGMKAIETGDMRAAVAYLCNGLKLAAVSNPGPNEMALRVTLLSTAANSLAVGGYRDGWQRLVGWLGLHRRAWHASSLASVELSLAISELHSGVLIRGAHSLARTAECAGIVSAESIRTVAVGMHHGLASGNKATAPEDGQHRYFLGGFNSHGRNALEELQRDALMRHPETVATLMREAGKFRDPRAVLLHRCAEAQLGLTDPLAAAREVLAAGHGFHAAWIIDGVLAKMLLSDPENTPWLVKLSTAKDPDVLGVIYSLVASWGARGIPGVDAELASTLLLMPGESLPVLPFLAHETAQRTLTPRESEITALAAGGLSNKAIARELTLSVRTVEGHVASVMAKRGLGTRGDLGFER